jgi:hypothetical protein
LTGPDHNAQELGAPRALQIEAKRP